MTIIYILFSVLLMAQSAVAATDLPMDTLEIADGVRMPVMSIGCGGLEHHDAYDIVTQWLDLGGTGIDTALNYGNQDQVQQAIRDCGIAREELFLTTKIPDCNVTNVLEYIHADLKLLNTTYLDLLLIHGPRNGNCVKAWKVLEQSFFKNQSRAIGVSNFLPADLESIVAQGKIVPHVNQIQLNLLQKDTATIEYCAKHGIHVEAYSPLGKGKVAQDHPIVQRIARAHNVSAYQVALKWILQHGWILTFQSSSQKHQSSDADVFGFRLSDTEMKVLDEMKDVNGLVI